MPAGCVFRSSRGQALVMATMSLFMLFGVMGLAVDLGWSYYRKQVAQTAADSAAMAAAVVAYNSTSGGIITCGSNKVVCWATPTVCPAITGNPGNNIENGCLYAKANGFTNGGTQTVTMASSALGTAPNPSNFSILYTVTATVTETNPQIFSALLGHQYGQVAVQSTAQVIQPPLPACIYALNQSASNAVLVSGSNSYIQSTSCGIAVNSSSSTALVVSGNANVTSAFEKIVGGFQIQGQSSISPTPVTGVSHFADPLVALAAPPPPTKCDYTNYNNQNGPPNSPAVTLAPGTYCGGIYVGGSANVTFNPGVYYVYGGGITFNSSNSTAVGTGVTFFNTDGHGVSGLPTSNFAPITISGQPNVTLSAPSTGTYNGVLFFKDRTVSSANNNDQINGSSQPKLTGTIYLPGDKLTLTGGVSTGQNQPSIIADTILVNGGGVIVQTTTSGTSQSKFVALVQ
jgi:Putative Flp pilus-assembly TadE/G-like